MAGYEGICIMALIMLILIIIAVIIAKRSGVRGRFITFYLPYRPVIVFRRSSDLIRCPRCGKTSEDENVCDRCGYEFELRNADDTGKKYQLEYEIDHTPRNRINATIAIVIAVSVILIIIILSRML